MVPPAPPAADAPVAPAPAASAAPAPAPSALPAAQWPAGTGPYSYGTPTAPWTGAPAARTPAPAGRRKVRPLTWVAVALAAFLVGGAVAGGVLLMREGKGGGGADKPSATTPPPSTATPTPSGGSSGPSAPSGPSTDVSGPSAPRATGEPPEGFERMTSPEGFTLAVPQGWTRNDKGRGQIDYAGPTGLAHLRVGVLPQAGKSAYDHFLEMEKTVSRQDGYQRLKLTANTFDGRPGALWEWTYREKDGRTVHAADQAYLDEKGNEFAVLYEDWGDAWGVTHKTFDTALRYWWVGPVDFD
ncbi:hypothetical protein AB0K09_25830 [Streptomyces sp. NPDC049577]|uniref:hypothetical protein n=1 Tax=Streptomyces sp. NPDC049577 TaxID=3155153 RepID=UPI0034154023